MACKTLGRLSGRTIYSQRSGWTAQSSLAMDALLWTLLLCCAAVAAVNANCSEDEFPCQRRHGGSCLPLQWVCDGDNDCRDSSDESVCGSPRTCPDGFFSCQSGRCILSDWVCDGANDCRDHGSDEQNCDTDTSPTPASQCADDQFACRSPRRSSGCIPMRWVCDGDRGDCYDGSDENQCGSPRTCPSDHFACDSGRCIPNTWVCDGANDCHDTGSDERNCHATTTTDTPFPAVSIQHCPDDEFPCRSHRRSSGCIPLRWVCDGDSSDCVDGEDERNCGSPRPCPSGHFSCESGQCIPDNWVCDGANDCHDSGSDERNCHRTTTTSPTAHCAADEFACQSNRRSSGCIPRTWVCDGDHRDCVDDSDERNCAQHSCAANEFACQSPRRSNGCIPRSWVCDHDHGDCVDDSDERNCGVTTNQTAPSPVNSATAPVAGCSEEQFACASQRWRGGCVPLAAVCDGRAGDCNDGSDETHCGEARTCPERWFACASGRCVPPAMICDGRVQCPDGGDETHCGNPAVAAAVPQTPERVEVGEEAPGGAVKLEIPSWLAADQDAHFALSLAPMLRARTPRDKLDAQMAVLRLFRDLARN